MIEVPFVTVVMPVRNESRWIAKSVGAVLSQDYPPDRLEIIIADGMSEDGTGDIIKRLPGAQRIILQKNHQRIQAAGLNRAVRKARGSIIVRVDGHTIIATDYVRHCVQLLQSTGADAVGGTLDFVGQTAFGHAISVAEKSPFAVPTTFRVGHQAQFTDTVYMGAWHRRVFDCTFGFDERLAVNEDYEFNIRLRQAGRGVYFSPELRSEYYGSQTVKGLARRYYRYGFWKPRTIRKHPRSVRLRHLAAPLLVAFISTAGILGCIIPIVHEIWRLGLLTYLLAIAVASLHAARRASRTSAWLIPLVFITIHCSWGIGFWIGIYSVLHQGKLPRPSLP